MTIPDLGGTPLMGKISTELKSSVEGTQSPKTDGQLHQQTATERSNGLTANGHSEQQVDHTDTDTANFRLANLLASRSRFRDALNILEPLISQHPKHVEALSLHARCLAANGSKPEAMASYASALSLNPDHVSSLLGTAALYKDASLLEDALHQLEKAHTVASTNPEVCHALALILTDLGTQWKAAGKEGWLECYSKAVQVAPQYAPAHYNLGVAAAEKGDAEEALACYDKAVELHKGYAEAWCNMGAVYKGQGEILKAIEAYERALEAAPNLELIQANLAVALTEYGTTLKLSGIDTENAIKQYERALAIRPKHAEALYNLGVAFAEQGHMDKAVFMYETAISAAPQCPEAHNNLGVLFRELGNGERAIQCYKAALDIRPNFPQALSNLAVMYTQQGRAQEALGLLNAAIMAAPAYAEAYNNLGVLQRDIGDVLAAITSYEQCLLLDPTNRNAGQNKLLGLNYIEPGESELVCDAHTEWGRHFESLHQPLEPPVVPSERRKDSGDALIVGYVSPDMFTHSVSYFAEAPLRWHDTKRIKHIVYSCCPKEDAKTRHLKEAVAQAGGMWKDVSRVSEPDLASIIRTDKVDILVELTGHTAGNRLATVAMKPAPVQVTWIGYPNSTGLSTVDYRFTDDVCDPNDTTQTFSEELVQLPGGCFLCYTPAVDAPEVSKLPAEENGFVTFGSFNALAKETPEVLQVWARILLAIPNSRLVLKNKPFACESVRCEYWKIFEQAGVGRQRVDLLPLVAGTGDHLSQYSMMDISLDPWPYAGTTTTAESLYMGVPCLTLAGRCHAQNVGKSLLMAVGLDEEWVATSVDEYVSKAIEHASDIAKLSSVRANLRSKIMASKLCDGPNFVRGLEDVYWSLWKRWEATESS